MINYLERALHQAQPEDEETAASRTPLLMPPPLGEVAPQRSERAGTAIQKGAKEVLPASSPLTRSLSRAAKTDPLGAPTAQGVEQSVLTEPAGAVTRQTETEGRFLLSQRTKEPSLLSLQKVPRPVDLTVQPLLTALRRSESAADFVRQPSRALTVTLPDAPTPTAPGLTPRELDRAVERDARRYDGGFSLY